MVRIRRWVVGKRKKVVWSETQLPPYVKINPDSPPGHDSGLQPGDVVYFDYNAAHGLGYIDHAGIYVGSGMVLSAVSEKGGLRTESISWYEAGGLHFVGGVRYWSSSSPQPTGPLAARSPWTIRDDIEVPWCCSPAL